MKNNKMTAVIISILCTILALTVGGTALLIAYDTILSNQNGDNESETESESVNDEIPITPPMELADERHLTFLKTEDDMGYTVKGLFGEVGAIKIVIPETFKGLPVIGIENGAFSSSSDLVTVVMPDTLKYIGEGAFESCNNLKDVTLSKNLEYVGDYAFEGCDALELNEYDNALYFGSDENPYIVLMQAKDEGIESCKVHDDTKIIYASAFYNCTELDEVSIPDGIRQIGIGAFEECYDLFPNPDETSPEYTYTKDADYLGNENNPFLVLVRVRGGKNITAIEVHSDTKIIAPGAFVGCEKLESINIPDSLQVIGEYAFEGCKSLESVTVSSGASWYVFVSDAVYQNNVISTNDSEEFLVNLIKKNYACSFIKK